MWREHYDTLLNSCTKYEEKHIVLERFGNLCNDVGMCVTMSEVMKIVQGLPIGKSPGMDGLTGESMKHADPLLSLLLSICFTCMFKHSDMPIAMLNSVIIPLVKNKCGDLSDKNNYRPIALSSIISKNFEHVILSVICHASKNICGLTTINLDLNLAMELTYVFMLLMNLLNTLRAILPFYCIS